MPDTCRAVAIGRDKRYCAMLMGPAITKAGLPVVWKGKEHPVIKDVGMLRIEHKQQLMIEHKA